MKILLSNHGLNQYGGSETWVKAMFGRLSLTHEVHVYTPNSNTIFPEMPPYDSTVPYDLGILNHAMCLTFLRDKNIKRIIYTSHGVIPGAERPVEGADVYVSVSEEVQATLAAKGFESVVIRNPIDTERFRAKKPPRPTLTKIAWISNNPRNVEGNIKRTARGLGINLRVVGRQAQLRDVKPILEDADLVIGLGRSAYEAMSMGRNTVVYDYNGADGFVTLGNIKDFRTSNCSGRFNKLKWSEAQLAEALSQYNPDFGADLRGYIAVENNVIRIAERYLCL